MHVSVEHIRKNYGSIPMIGATDAPVFAGAIEVANSVPVPIAFVSGGASTYIRHTVDGAEYIVIRVEADTDELEVYNSLRHELIHYDQVLRGDLVVSDKQGRAMWKGVEYVIERGPMTYKPSDPIAIAQNALATVKYVAQPWEWEACQHELGNYVGDDVFEVMRAVHAEHGTVWAKHWLEYSFFNEIKNSGLNAASLSKAYAASVRSAPY